MNIDGQPASNGPGDTAITVDEAGSAFDHLLGYEADTDEEEALAPEYGVAPEDGAEEEEDDLSSEDDDEDADGEEPEDQDDAASEARLVTVKVDGQMLQVTQDELIRSYQLDATARQRLEKVALKDKALEAEYHGLGALQQRVGYLAEQVAATLQAPDYDPAELEVLRASDPAEYAARKLEMRERQEQLAGLEAEARRLEAIEHHRSQAAHQARLGQAQEALLAAFPEWRNPRTAEAAMGELAAYAERHLGVSDQEFDAIDDARVIQALHKARLFDQLTAKAARAGERVRAGGRARPVLTPGAAERTAPAQLNQARSLKRLKQTGSVRDAADAFSALL